MKVIFTCNNEEITLKEITKEKALIEKCFEKHFGFERSAEVSMEVKKGIYYSGTFFISINVPDSRVVKEITDIYSIEENRKDLSKMDFFNDVLENSYKAWTVTSDQDY